jgi:hypothetical protein
MKEEILDRTSPRMIASCHVAGWMYVNIFTSQFFHFIEVVKPPIDSPIVLTVDDHFLTHKIWMLDSARKHSVSIIHLPPHSTHNLQPLDVGFMAP